MFDKIILTFITIMILLGAAMIAVPIPVLWGMGCLSFLALSVAFRRQRQG
jgi:hypothetical protein